MLINFPEKKFSPIQQARLLSVGEEFQLILLVKVIYSEDCYCYKFRINLYYNLLCVERGEYEKGLIKFLCFNIIFFILPGRPGQEK